MKCWTTLAAVIVVALHQASLVASHGGVIGYNLANKYYNGYGHFVLDSNANDASSFSAYNTPVGQSSIQREWDTYNPLTNPTDSFLPCNNNGATLGSGQLSATVAAGSKVVAYWNQWPHTIGPVMVYMASCGGACASATPSALSWFKIDQGGLLSGTLTSGQWAMGKLVANNNSWTSTIPSGLASGEYMIRHELLAIHTSNQPQFYPECAHLVITGSGSARPAGNYLVKFPGAYHASDPGVTIDIYSQPTVTNYTIPGPAVWSG